MWANGWKIPIGQVQTANKDRGYFGWWMRYLICLVCWFYCGRPKCQKLSLEQQLNWQWMNRISFSPILPSRRANEGRQEIIQVHPANSVTVIGGKILMDQLLPLAEFGSVLRQDTEPKIVLQDSSVSLFESFWEAYGILYGCHRCFNVCVNLACVIKCSKDICAYKCSPYRGTSRSQTKQPLQY